MTIASPIDKGEEGSNSSLKLRKEPAYWYEYDTHVKARWTGRQLLEILVTEFRDRSSEYYQWAIHSGMCRINGEKSSPDHILKMSDKIQHRVHRHEPAVTAEPIRILERNDELGRLVVVKPGSIPVHATGRFTKLTLLHILQQELKIETIQTSNRLDRLTSGIMVCTTRKDTAHTLSEQFAMGKVRKAYVCRVKGKFTEKEILVEEPLLQCDRQSGSSIVHPLGKHSETIFNRLSYDEQSDTSVVYCRPITGRTHQIRVHVQYIGHPIVNDPIYAHPIWQKYPPTIFKSMNLKEQRWKIDPGSSMSIWGSDELDAVVASIKTSKDDNEDWARWRDEILFGQLLEEEGVKKMEVPGANGESASDQKERSEKAQSNENNEEISSTKYCDECKTPLLPDPREDELYIYLHAIKYQTDDWTYEDQLPWWALENWKESKRKRNVNDSLIETGIASDAIMSPAFGLVGRGEKVEREIVTLPKVQPLVSIQDSLPDINSIKKPEMKEIQSHPPIVFEIFGGMEDFAAHDISLQLNRIFGKTLSSLNINHQLYNGHLSLPRGDISALALQLFLDGHIFCVKTAFIQIASPNMPTETMLSLSNEKSKLYEARSVITKNRKKTNEESEKAIAEAQKVPGMNGKLTLAEEEFMKDIQAVWDECKEGRQEALNLWQELHGNQIDQNRKPRFRASCDRRGYSLPTLTTGQMEKVLGDYIWFWLNGDPDLSEGDWEVNLVHPDLEIVLKLLAGQDDNKLELEPHWATNPDNVPGRFAFLIPINGKISPKHRPVLPTDLIGTGTVLARFRAYSLATALPFSVDRIDSCQENEDHLRIWEPCAGSGSVAVELAAACERKGIHCKIFASDVSENEIERAKQTFKICGYEDYIKLATIDATKNQEVISFIGEENSLDGIVTDLPWGRRSLNHQAISKMYPSMFQIFYKMLKPGGIALLMTAENNNLLRAAKVHEAESRRRGYDWFLNVEKFNLTPCNEEESIGIAPTDEQRSSSVRLVDCGYYVSLVLLRKVPLIV